MIIKPKTRGFICINAHPEGCAANVKSQIDYVKSQGYIEQSPKKVLIIGASTGYGLASRITAAFAGKADTLGVFFEKPPTEKKCASAGWYNAAAFEKAANQEGLYAKSINGDAFSHEIKDKTIAAIKADMGKVDLVIYSLASPRRQDPTTSQIYNSVLKPIGKSVTLKGVNTDKQSIEEVTLEEASEQEIADTVSVMGGEDWEMWIEALSKAGVLADNCITSAYTYIGEKVTWDIYWDGTIGQAKKDLDRAEKSINQTLSTIGGKAYVSVLKALVTQASSAIPVMPLYLSLLFKVMKENNTHEGCIEQIYGLFSDCLYASSPVQDSEGRMRRDGFELKPEVQNAVEELWPTITTENLHELTDFQGYKTDFLNLFGFEVAGIDYEAETSPLVEIDLL